MSGENSKQVEALKAYVDVERKRTRMLRKALDAANKKRRELAKEMLESRAALEIERERPKVRANAVQLAMRLRDENTRLQLALDASKSAHFAAQSQHEERARENTRLQAKLDEDAATYLRMYDGARAERDAARDENTRLQAAVESGATLLRIATRALGFYAEPGRWSHEPQGWAWAVTDEGPERAARAIESIRAKSPASDKNTDCQPAEERDELNACADCGASTAAPGEVHRCGPLRSGALELPK